MRAEDADDARVLCEVFGVGGGPFGAAGRILRVELQGEALLAELEGGGVFQGQCDAA